MTVLEATLLWGSTFSLVFLMGMQSRSVNSGEARQAAGMSFLIACAQCISFRGVVTGEPWLVILMTGTAGPLAIVTAMKTHAWVRSARNAKKENDA